MAVRLSLRKECAIKIALHFYRGGKKKNLGKHCVFNLGFTQSQLFLELGVVQSHTYSMFTTDSNLTVFWCVCVSVLCRYSGLTDDRHPGISAGERPEVYLSMSGKKCTHTHTYVHTKK